MFLFKILSSSFSSHTLKRNRDRTDTFIDLTPPPLRKYFKTSSSLSPELIHDDVPTLLIKKEKEYRANIFYKKGAFTSLCLTTTTRSFLEDILNLDISRKNENNILLGLTLCKKVLHDWILNHKSDPVSTKHHLSLHTLHSLNHTLDLKLPVSHKTLNKVIRKSFKFPVLILGGWENHYISYVLFKYALYFCNTGEGGEYHSNKKKPNQINVISFKMISFSEIQQMIYSLQRIIQEPYSPDFINYFLLKEKTSPYLFYFHKTAQRSFNCWYRSPLFGINVMMILIGQSLGLSIKESHSIFKSILGKEARMRNELHRYFSQTPKPNSRNFFDALKKTYPDKPKKLAYYIKLATSLIETISSKPSP